MMYEMVSSVSQDSRAEESIVRHPRRHRGDELVLTKSVASGYLKLEV